MEIAIDIQTKGNRTDFPVLYAYTEKGQVQQWQIIAEGDKYWTVEGIQGGKLTESLPTVCTGKHIGKKNETSAAQQAILEAKAKWKKKAEAKYNQVLSAEKKFFEPMLAHSYDDYGAKIDWKKSKVFVQPKLDGLRAINNGKTIMSRNGKPLTAPHVLHELEVILDGELYSHQFKDDFNKIVSLCKKQKPTQEELDECAQKIEHWVYDYPSHNGVFSERFNALLQMKENGNLPESVVIVETYEVANEEEIREAHAQFIGAGYEGTIVRIDAPYENKRSKNLLKFKDFVDEEFEIIGYAEGEGGRVGTIGKFWCRLDKDKPYIIDESKPVNCFKSNVKGNFDYLREIWNERDSYIGKTATVKYFNRTPKQEDGTGDVPRFPYIIKINRESYE